MFDFNHHLVNIVNNRMGPDVMTRMHSHFEDYEDHRVMVVKCKTSSTPVFLKDGNVERFYIRTGPSTTELTASQIMTYTKHRFGV